MDIPLPVQGGCNCGAVRYVLRRAPVTCYICHCHLCQKRTGSPFSMTLVLPSGALEVTSGDPEAATRTTPSGAKSTFWSCGSCHSRIWSERSDRPGQGLRPGTLDDTSWVRPVAQFWTTSAQPWALVPDILNYAEQPTESGAMLAAWKALS